MVNLWYGLLAIGWALWKVNTWALALSIAAGVCIDLWNGLQALRIYLESRTD